MVEYLKGLAREEVASELVNHHPTIGYTDALEVLAFFRDDYKSAAEFLREEYAPEEGDVVIQLAVYGHNIKGDEGLVGQLDPEDVSLLLMEEGDLEREIAG